MGAWSGLGGVAGAVGPFLGGWLVEWTWRAVFLINLPLAALVIVVAMRHVPESRDPESAPGLDVSGAALGALGLGLLTWGLTTLGADGVTALGLGTTAAGVVALVAFWLVERRSPHPLVPPALFANPVFSAANAATLLIYGPLSVVFLVLVLQLQTVAGFSPVAAGTALLPLTVIMFLFSARVGALAGRIGPRIPMTVGPLVAACGLLLLLRVGPGASWLTDVLPAMVVFGAGMTLTVSPLTATVLDAAPDRFAGSASGRQQRGGARGRAAGGGDHPGDRGHHGRRLRRPGRARRGLPHVRAHLGRAGRRRRRRVVRVRSAARGPPRPPTGCGSRSASAAR